MKKVSGPLFRIALVTACVAALFAAGCTKKPPVVPPPVAQTPPPARPTVTLQANPTSLNKGDSTTLSWSSTNATQLTIAPEVGAGRPARGGGETVPGFAGRWRRPHEHGQLRQGKAVLHGEQRSVLAAEPARPLCNGALIA